LSGSSLLRKGKQSGKVAVNFEIDGKNVIIERQLSRKKDSVKQETGFIEIEGRRESFSVEELNAAVLRLISYPQVLSGINPSMLYRYTVYTPQEEMKQILIENEEERLNILRNVLGTNKYKTIIQNAEIFSKFLRDDMRKKEGKISDLEQKKEELAKRKQVIEQFSQELKQIMPGLQEATKNLLEKKKILLELEKERRKLIETEKIIKSHETAVISKKDELKRINARALILEPRIKDLESEIAKKMKFGITPIETKIIEKEKEIDIAAAKETEIAKIISSIETKKESFLANIDKISRLSTCPLCQQEVPHEHKEKISKEMNDFLKENEAKLASGIDELKGIKQKINSLKEDLKKLRIEKEDKEKMSSMIREFDEKRKDFYSLKFEAEKIDNEIKKLGQELESFRKELESCVDVSSKYNEASIEADMAKEQETKIEIQRTRIETNLKNYSEMAAFLEKEIAEKEKSRNDLEKLRKIEFWLSNEFVLLMALIEKNILLKLNFEFNQFFQKWFGMLISDESFSVKVNEEFTPIIEQNGYELEYSFLSGGERTAAALAYRLALNQVLNSLYSSIKTQDFLVLDEPTDGFSSEQLDRMRAVLQELKAGQLVLVSHEQRVESFVEKIIKFKKQDGSTKLVN
jgi:exonuclease SbcC